MCRKHNAPFKCTFVPESAIVSFLIKHKQLSYRVWCERLTYTAVLDAYVKNCGWRPPYNPTRYQLRLAEKRYRASIFYQQFVALLGITFNYEPSTLVNGDVVTRCMRIYEKHNLKSKINEPIKTT